MGRTDERDKGVDGEGDAEVAGGEHWGRRGAHAGVNRGVRSADGEAVWGGGGII